MKFVIVLLYVTLSAFVTCQNQWPREHGYYQTQPDPKICSRNTCRLPSCFCAGNDAPLQMEPSVIPQIVMFTFDDAVNEEVIDYFKELFPQERVNPNGCPVTATFFVSHNWTDYNMVKSLYDRGHEIASHSITHKMPQSWWRYARVDEWENEIEGQRSNIIEKAGIPRKAVTGMRAPFLDTGGDEQFAMLDKEGYQYDASFMTGPHDRGGAWPFTLDSVPNWKYCTNLNCPQDRHPGIWEVPLNRWVGIDGNGCSMVDSCQQQPGHKGEALAYLWQNFNRHYYGNRAPVGVNMHATWFKTGHHYDAMKEFAKTISEMDDVYLLTVQETLAWMKRPQTIDRALTFKPWLKSCSILQGRPLPLPNSDSDIDQITQENSNEFPQQVNRRRINNGHEFSEQPTLQVHEPETDDIKLNSRYIYDSNTDNLGDEYFENRKFIYDNSNQNGDVITRHNTDYNQINDKQIDFELEPPKFEVETVKVFPTQRLKEHIQQNRNVLLEKATKSTPKQLEDGYEYYEEDEPTLAKPTSPSTSVRKTITRQNVRGGQRPANIEQVKTGRRGRPIRLENQTNRQQRLAKANSAHVAHAHLGIIISASGLTLLSLLFN